MKKSKLLSVVLVGSMVATMFTGCSLPFKVSSESLTEEYYDTMNNMKSANLDMDMTFNMELSDGETSMEMAIKANSKMALNYEDEENYITSAKTKAKVSMFGMSETVKNESYTVVEDGFATTYSKDSDSEYWDVSDTEIDMSESMTEAMTTKVDFTLEKDTVDYNGEECYVLTGEMDGDEFEDVLDSMGMGSDNTLATFKVYMTKKEHTPVNVTFTIDSDALKESMAEEFELEELEDVDMTISDFVISIDIEDINEKIKIEIPEDALDSDNWYEGDGPTEEIVEPEPTEPIEKPEIDNPVVIEDNGLEKFTDLGFAYTTNKVSDKYGTTIYLMTVNEKDVDKTFYVEATFYKDGLEVDQAYRSLELEAGTFGVTRFYTDREYDEVKYEVEESKYCEDLIGSDIDIYYTITKDGEFYGTIENNTDETIEYATAHIVFFDKDKNVVGYEYTYANSDEIAPGDSDSYDTYIDTSIKFDSYVVYVVGYAKE